LIRSLASRLLGLPAPALPIRIETEWLVLSDGVRLATTCFRPRDAGDAPTVLARTLHGPARRRGPLALLARVLACQGYRVLVQEVRGRGASEGRFEPFVHEAKDARDTLERLAGDAHGERPLALLGVGYGAYAAFAALAASPRRVDALVCGFGARRPFSLFHEGGALALESALRFAAEADERESPSPSQLDLGRAVLHRPLVEADRVALRRSDWWQACLAHPSPDAWWTAREPALPRPPPPALLFAGWGDAALAAAFEDRSALQHAAAGAAERAPRVVVGPWAGGRVLREPGVRAARLPALLARETLAFLEHHLRGRGPRPGPAVVFVRGAGRWRELAAWPPPARERVLHPRSAGRLDEEAPAAGEPSERFAHDPAHPAAPGLAWTTSPLADALEIAGTPRLELHAACDAPDADFAARLLEVDAGGSARLLCEGALRCRWREGESAPRWIEPGAPLTLGLALGPVCARVAAGHRLRLEIAGSAFPRLDANPAAEVDPAAVRTEDLRRCSQTVFHDAERPSRLLLPVTAGPGERGPEGPGSGRSG
jgi:hypothetical protein